MWEKRERGEVISHAGVLLPSESVSHYSCKNLPKTDDHDRYGQCCFLDMCFIGVVQVTCFVISENLC